MSLRGLPEQLPASRWIIPWRRKRSDEFGKVPSVFDYAKTDEDRAILQFHFGQFCSAARWPARLEFRPIG